MMRKSLVIFIFFRTATMAVFIDRKIASQFLKPHRKRDDFLAQFGEEFRESFESECIEEGCCSREEVREVLEDNQITENFWESYNSKRCVPNPCVEANSVKCEELTNFFTYNCICKTGYEGQRCQNTLHSDQLTTSAYPTVHGTIQTNPIIRNEIITQTRNNERRTKAIIAGNESIASSEFGSVGTAKNEESDIKYDFDSIAYNPVLFIAVPVIVVAIVALIFLLIFFFYKMRSKHQNEGSLSQPVTFAANKTNTTNNTTHPHLQSECVFADETNDGMVINDLYVSADVVTYEKSITCNEEIYCQRREESKPQMVDNVLYEAFAE